MYFDRPPSRRERSKQLLPSANETFQKPFCPELPPIIGQEGLFFSWTMSINWDYLIFMKFPETNIIWLEMSFAIWISQFVQIHQKSWKVIQFNLPPGWNLKENNLKSTKRLWYYSLASGGSSFGNRGQMWILAADETWMQPICKVSSIAL